MSEVTYDSATCIYPGAERPAVDELQLAIKDGEFVVMVGPSGCGKTTALRMLAGLEEIDGGSIRIDGKDMVGVPSRNRDIAMVFQNYALYPSKTVGENMGFALKMQGVAKDERARRVREAAELLDLEPYLDRKPRNLSGGQRQRVAMGRAIVREPKVFCMDEPLSNLDAQLRVSTRTQIAELQRRLGITTVYVTHDQVEAMTMGDRIAVINEGVLQQAGSPKELYELPQNRFVAGFIGSPSMNFVEVKIDVSGGTVKLSEEGVELIPDDVQSALLRDSGLEKVIVGFRPEHLIAGVPPGPGLRITAAIDVIEFLGNDQLIHGITEGHDIVAIVNADTELSVGESVVLSTEPRRLHLFNPTTGERIAKAA
jgi:multiple sugar transport system ATP-binding protein